MRTIDHLIAGHGGDGLWLSVDQRLHLDPQYGELDDRHVRQPGSEGQVPALADHDGAHCELLPHRTELGIGRRGAQDPGGARRRPLCRQRIEAIHLGRGRERDLCHDGPHRQGGPQGHFVPRHREGHARRQLRRQRAQARLAFAADPASDLRGCPRAGREPGRRRRRRLPLRDDGPRRRPAQHRRLLARRGAALPRRGDPVHEGPPAIWASDRGLPEHPVHACRHGRPRPRRGFCWRRARASRFRRWCWASR